MSKRDRRELANRLVVLVMHVLKWRYQPERRRLGWQRTMIEQRRRLTQLLRDTPSLRSQLPALVADVYPTARAKAADETGLSVETFPLTCPWTAEQLLVADFWPKG